MQQQKGEKKKQKRAKRCLQHVIVVDLESNVIAMVSIKDKPDQPGSILRTLDHSNHSKSAHKNNAYVVFAFFQTTNENTKGNIVVVYIDAMSPTL